MGITTFGLEALFVWTKNLEAFHHHLETTEAIPTLKILCFVLKTVHAIISCATNCEHHACNDLVLSAFGKGNELNELRTTGTRCAIILHTFIPDTPQFNHNASTKCCLSVVDVLSDDHIPSTHDARMTGAENCI